MTDGMLYSSPIDTDMNITTDNTSLNDDKSLRMSVRNSLKNYFSQLGDLDPANLYKLVLEEVEIPLIKMVLQYTRGNQSRAAIILGMSRGTLRKKIAQYRIEDYNEID